MQELREAIESLRDHVQIVWQAIDEVREVIDQALGPDSRRVLELSSRRKGLGWAAIGRLRVTIRSTNGTEEQPSSP